MADRHEKTHGGFGPTHMEWDDEIFPEIHEDAERISRGMMEELDRVATLSKVADKVYSYTGKQYLFMRLAVESIWTFINEYVAIQNKAAGFRAKRLEALEERVHTLDGIAVTKTLDIEAYDVMAEMAERLERLESNLQEIADSGFRYRGYWRDGIVAKRGDAFTNDGSMWWALRDTTDKPCKESAHWQVAVRKGRDGK